MYRRIAWLPALALVATAAAAKDLSFDERVAAQTAIERVYWSHQIGTSGAFEAAVPRAVIESKVSVYLKKSAALDQLWKTPVTAEMLAAELDRIAAATRLPDRLEEVYAALGNDPFLVAESIARPALVDRLVRSFFGVDERFEGTSWDRFWEDREGGFDGSRVRAVGCGAKTLERPRALSGLTPPDDLWDNGMLDDVPDPRWGHVAVWTGSHMLVWGGWPWFYTTAQLEGARYDPLTDSWSPMSGVGEPIPRDNAAAVWTGSRLIVWGGGGIEECLGTGGRYDPVADAWTPVANVGAPPGRCTTTAVWAGSRFIVWGGTDVDGNPLNSGGSYDPGTDTWSAVATTGAPSARMEHSAVWTGSRMVVWGGWDGTGFVNTGGRYDPVTNTWQSTRTSTAPAARSRHAAVWTGSRMVLWGGGDDQGQLATGGSYDPGANQWSALATAGAPTARTGHTAVWTGSRMIVWGGWDLDLANSGGSYDPLANSWQTLSTTNAPLPRERHTAVWTGSQMIVWGGSFPSQLSGVSELDSGGRYDPATDTWTPTSRGGLPEGRHGHSTVWTGNLMLVWGGVHEHYEQPDVPTASGLRYDPALATWSPITAAGQPPPRTGSPPAVWTGTRMIVWGGLGTNGSTALGSGGRYDPVADQWTATSSAGAPSARFFHTAVWTGSRMVVWGGQASTELGDGGRYDPTTDTWQPTSPAGAPSPRLWHTAVWTGKRMLVWGGAAFGNIVFQDGAQYDAQRDTWIPMSVLAAPPARMLATAAWTGERMLVWGGQTSAGPEVTGGSYDPVGDSWSAMSSSGSPARGTGVWTRSRFVVWDPFYSGGLGARYDPAMDAWSPMGVQGAPMPRSEHGVVWANDRLIVWGGWSPYGADLGVGGAYVEGSDGDGDGAPDAIDNCIAQPNASQADADLDGLGDACDCAPANAGAHSIPEEATALRIAGTATLSWDPLTEGGTGTVVDVLRGRVDQFPVGSGAAETCAATVSGQTSWTDTEAPPAARGFWYLVRGRNACGSSPYGFRSNGSEEVSGACP